MKALGEGGHSVRPFTVHKTQTYQYAYLSGSNPEQVSIDLAVVPPAVGLWSFSSASSPRNPSGLYSETLYASIKHLFYSSSTLISAGASASLAFTPAGMQDESNLLFRYRVGDDITDLGGTFSRASTATYIDADGIVQTASVDEIRDGHYINGTRHLLVEASRTNVMTYSSDFMDASYGVGGVTKVGGFVAPNGSSEAVLAQETATSGLHQIVKAYPTFAPNTSQSVSVFVKASGRTAGEFIGIFGTDRFGVVFDLDTETLTDYEVGDGKVFNKSLTTVADGWYRLTVAGLPGSGSTSGNWYFRNNSGGTNNYSGDGVSGLLWWGFQAELNAPVASSYIPTSGAAATRSADNLEFEWVHAPQPMSIYTRMTELGTVDMASGTYAIWTIGKVAPRMAAYNTSNRWGIFHHNGTANEVASGVAPAPQTGDTVELIHLVSGSGAVQAALQVTNLETTGSGNPSDPLEFADAYGENVLTVGGWTGPVTGLFAIQAIEVVSGSTDLDTVRETTDDQTRLYVISMAQQGHGEGIVSGSFRLTAADATGSIVDDGKGHLIYSGSSAVVGNIFYGMGIATLRHTDGPFKDAVLSPYGAFFDTGSVVTVQFDATHTIYEHTITCTMDIGDFNYSLNPTCKGSSSLDDSGAVIDKFASGSLTPYMTTIGLYTAAGELVVVAKFPKPIKRAPDSQQTVVVRFDA